MYITDLSLSLSLFLGKTVRLSVCPSALLIFLLLVRKGGREGSKVGR